MWKIPSGNSAIQLTIFFIRIMVLKGVENEQRGQYQSPVLILLFHQRWPYHDTIWLAMMAGITAVPVVSPLMKLKAWLSNTDFRAFVKHNLPTTISLI